LVVLLVVWEVYASGVSVALLARPSEIARAFYQLAIAQPILWSAILVSGQSFIVGFGVAIFVGVVVGLAMGRSRVLGAVLDPWVFFVYAIPSIALIPMLIIWFGVDEVIKFVLVFLASVFTIIINTAAGVKNVDPELVDVGRSFCAGELQITRTVIVPAALPFIFAGIRIATSQAIVGVIGAEFLVVNDGLGGLILTSSDRFETANMFVPIGAIIVIALGLNASLRWMQSRVTRWESASREGR
jgi:NitT/TauT family transport system permease protein